MSKFAVGLQIYSKMFIQRKMAAAIEKFMGWYPIVYVGGPRQSGKTTLLKHLYGTLPYASLEEPDVRLLAEEDPRRFLSRFSKGGILDEVQRAPWLFSYLQGLVDSDASLRFLLSGSQNFLMMKQVSQSLAGRVGVLTLLPLSSLELSAEQVENLTTFMWRGGYPAIYERQIPPDIFFANYLQTYVERDVRTLKEIGNLTQFVRFMRLCAGRVGQPLNMSSLATQAGVAVNTVKTWLSVLEASYILFFLSPYHGNFKKRIIKSPKLYFFDTGLLCHLLGIAGPEPLDMHPYFGNIFENMIIAELYKKRANAGRRPVFWFWRDQHQHEVDLIIEEEGQLMAIEIKGSQTYNARLASGLKRWKKLAGERGARRVLVYSGSGEMKFEDFELLPWARAVEEI